MSANLLRRDGPRAASRYNSAPCCRRTGSYECLGTIATICNATPRPSSLEDCNEVDDDCDGRVDEGVTNACGGCSVLNGVVGGRCMLTCNAYGRSECSGTQLRCAPCVHQCGNVSDPSMVMETVSDPCPLVNQGWLCVPVDASCVN